MSCRNPDRDRGGCTAVSCERNVPTETEEAVECVRWRSGGRERAVAAWVERAFDAEDVPEPVVVAMLARDVARSLPELSAP